MEKPPFPLGTAVRYKRESNQRWRVGIVTNPPPSAKRGYGRNRPGHVWCRWGYEGELPDPVVRSVNPTHMVVERHPNPGVVREMLVRALVMEATND